MSKSKYTIKEGEIAQINITGEPVLVQSIGAEPLDGNRLAVIIRPVVTQNGIEYRTEQIDFALLETRFEQAKRTVEFESFVQDLREDAANKRYVLSADSKAALKANAQQTLPFNG